MVIPSLNRSKHEILSLIGKGATRVFRKADLATLLRENRDRWGLAQNVRFADFLEFLTTEGQLGEVSLPSESDYSPIRRYVWGDITPFELALGLKEGSYLTHSTAVFLHDLTEQIPQTIYVNAEQSPKPKPTGELTQESLDRAFRTHQRSSRYVFIHERNRFVILSGKNTGRYGVVSLPAPDGRKVQTTDLERTLVDIVVRPAYGGGVHEVQAAFRAASDRLSISKLLATLRALDYVYPYHQALGFYLDRSGVPSKRLERLRKLGVEFNFYLAHGMKNPALDSSWRVFHPKGL